VKLVKTEEVSGYLKKENYGPEPLERGFTLKVFSDLLSGRSRKKIKPTLMDQTFVAGIGNLYTDEICFYAKIRPTRTIGSLTDNEIKKLFGGIKKILPEAIKYRGSSADQYLDAKGNPGAFVPRLKVYGREGEKCSRCDGVVKRIKIGGRSAHFCPKCQK
jgi:formamidopyrimidine-DNA glycosylase